MVGWNERERDDVGWRHRLRDQVRRLGGEAAEPPLLPGGHEPADGLVVRDGGARTGESEPAARAFPASFHGPRRWQTAAIAEGRSQPWQRLAAGVAELLGAIRAANGTAHRQQQIEKSHVTPRLTSLLEGREKSVTGV